MRSPDVPAAGDGRPRRFADWFLGPVPVHAMVLDRMILGGVLFLHAVSRIPEFGLLYGSASAAWSPAYREFVSSILAPGLGIPPLYAVSVLAQLEPASRQLVLVGLYAFLLGSSLAFACGLFTRTAGALAVGLHLVFYSVHPMAHYGWASVVAPFALYVVLSRAGGYASLDAWRRRRRGAEPPGVLVPAWPMRLLQVHVALLYLHMGSARLDDPGWLEGSVLFEALTRALFSRFALDLQAWTPLLVLLSRAVFLLEPAAAVLLWIPRLRTLCALALIVMHGVLEILTNVGWWNYVAMAGLLTFLPPAWLARGLPLADPRAAAPPGA